MANRGLNKKVLMGVIALLFLGMQLIAAATNAQGKIEQDLIDKINRNPSAMITVIVTYIDKADPSIIKRHNGKLGYDLKIINGHSARIRAGNVLNMAREAKIKKIYMNKPVKALLDESVPLINADAVHAQGVTGAEVQVCILDTGVDDGHPALPSLVAEYDFVNEDTDASDDNGHGTHVAGIIASNDGTYKGVAPDASLMAAKVLDATGFGTYEHVIAGVERCVEWEADIISISLGGEAYTTTCDDDILSIAVNNAVGNGVVVSVAAGNEGTAGITVPACASQAIAVGAVDKTSNVPWWSSRGPEMDIVAPGVDITSLYLNNQLATGDGTSASCPHVSGVAALLLETKSNATVAEVKDAMYSTAIPANVCYQCTRLIFGRCIRQAEVECTPEIVGAGIVDAYEAYLAIQPVGPECTADGDCDDGLFCNGAETCVADVCQAGTPVDCSALSDQCNDGVCDEELDECITQVKTDGTSCEDGLFCTENDYCSVGTCLSGTSKTCDDGENCTTDSCNENLDICENKWPECGLDDGCCGPECTSEDVDCPEENPCLNCFKDVCDDKCNPAKEDATCPDCW